MIRRPGSHIGRRILFGYDRYLVPELDAYRSYLTLLGEVVEPGDTDRLHYLTSAEAVCRAVQADPEAFGILCCGTGMGMSIAANKFSGIYAARCTTSEDAEMARKQPRTEEIIESDVQRPAAEVLYAEELARLTERVLIRVTAMPATALDGLPRAFDLIKAEIPVPMD